MKFKLLLLRHHSSAWLLSMSVWMYYIYKWPHLAWTADSWQGTTTRLTSAIGHGFRYIFVTYGAYNSMNWCRLTVLSFFTKSCLPLHGYPPSPPSTPIGVPVVLTSLWKICTMYLKWLVIQLIIYWRVDPTSNLVNFVK